MCVVYWNISEVVCMSPQLIMAVNLLEIHDRLYCQYFENWLVLLHSENIAWRFVSLHSNLKFKSFEISTENGN